MQQVANVARKVARTSARTPHDKNGIPHERSTTKSAWTESALKLLPPVLSRTRRAQSRALPPKKIFSVFFCPKPAPRTVQSSWRAYLENKFLISNLLLSWPTAPLNKLMNSVGSKYCWTCSVEILTRQCWFCLSVASAKTLQIQELAAGCAK